MGMWMMSPAVFRGARKCWATWARTLRDGRSMPEILASTVAWYQYRPGVAIGILMVFALVDLALYSLMKDVLVCYRCQSRHRLDGPTDGYERFNHERAERYRQEALRHSPTASAPSPNGDTDP